MTEPNAAASDAPQHRTSVQVPCCPLNACRNCPRCRRDDHSRCAGQVRCPSTGVLSTCQCCGTAEAAENVADKGPAAEPAAGMTRRTNGLSPLPVPVEDMSYPMQCKWCRCTHDTGKVTVVARYTDCSVWKCPGCGVTLDDRPAGWGGAYKVDRRTGEVLL